MESKGIVFCVDDEKSILEVYEYSLENAGYKPYCFTCASDMYSSLKSIKPDLFVLDIMLDGEDGYAILATLKQRADTQDIPVIMVSAKGTEIDKVKGLDLGADDYLAKPFGVFEFIARVNAKLRKKSAKKTVFNFKDIVVDDIKHTIEVSGKKVDLTLKEYELLKLFVKNAEAVLYRDKILDEVWGENYGETRTLDIHIGSLRKILENSSAKIETVRGVGYILK